MANSDVAKPLMSWMLGGIGALLVYSAYKKQSPLNILTGTVGPLTYSPLTGASPVGTPGTSGQPIPPGNEPARLRMLANRELQPTLVMIPGGGQLDASAALSLRRINTKLGFTVLNVGAYRSYAYQALLYAQDPNRFADPRKSLHVVGLAIDVHSSQANRADVISAFTGEGWHRARSDEPWHWSYGVRG